MTQSPVIPSTFHPSTIGLVQNYMDCLDSLPLDVQRCLTELREYDVEHRAKIEQVGLCLKKLEAEKSSTEKKKYMNKIQRLLINSQHIGDEKLRVISRIAELVENRTQMVMKCANEMNTSVTVTKEEEFKTNFPLTPKFKVDKTKIATPIEKSSKNSYDKPKRARRGMRTSDKVSNQRFNVPRDEDSRFSKDDEMEEEEEETEDFENDNEVENKSKRDMSYHRKKENSKVKYRGDEKADPRKEEKKSEKRDKSILKTSKKTGKGSGKMKKRKKKEKEISNLDEMAVDPDEPTYCICNSISYGDMIGCDNEECEIEWFHFGCVSLTHKPKGKWYCPGCTAERRELKSKK